MFWVSRIVAIEYIILQFSLPTNEQGNGNILALRYTPFDEIVPLHGYMPPDYIKERIDLVVKNFFPDPFDQAAAEEVLLSIWHYNPVYSMLATMDKMNRNQYTYAQYGDECEEDSGGNDVIALDTQQDAENEMLIPTFIYANDFFFAVTSWWDILGNTIMYLWEENEKIVSKVCDTRRRGLVCMQNSTGGGLTCDCPTSDEGVKLVGSKGGICAIEQGVQCDYNRGSRLMGDVWRMEVFNDLDYETDVFHTCFGNSYCSGDPEDNNVTKCTCWPLMTTEIRAKRNVLLNYSMGGERCDQIMDGKVLKWGKWYVAIAIFWFSFPIIIIVAPHWDYLFEKAIPGYYKYYILGVLGTLPEKLHEETHDIRMDPKVRKFIEECSVVVDVDDPEYFDRVDEVDQMDLDPIERFVVVPHCTDKHYHFDWPSFERLQVWF